VSYTISISDGVRVVKQLASVTSGGGTANPSGAHDFIPLF